MRRVMEIEGDGSSDDFLPTPDRPDFLANYHRTLSELRYSDPGWNRYVYRQRDVGQELMERREVEHQFQEEMQAIAEGHNPFGNVPLHTREGIQRQLDFTEQLRDWHENHRQLEELQRQIFATKNVYLFDANDAINAIAMGSRRCVARDGGTRTWESDDEYRERLVEAIVFQVAIHEFGHNLSLRHNFYGSVDAKHMHEGDTSASVMDYVWSPEEAGTPRLWGDYDKAALTWIYGTEDKREAVMAEDFLYCTDDHRNLSPLCTAHDLGITPSQITLNAIERYEWQYKFRNRRAYRTFWDTGSYLGSVYGGIFPIQRMWHLALFDWGGGGVQETLKRLDQVNGDNVLTDQEYDEIAQDFYNDVSAANGMMIAFYDAIINQPASFRNYQTEFDPFYGDILRLGIIYDKLFATLGFMDQQYVYYSPNVATYVSMWDAPFGTQNFALSQRVLDGMLGANYDTFPWFKYYALNIFAWATNSNLVNDIAAKERIAIERFENLDEVYEAYGQANIEFATQADNPQQTFVHEAELYVYTYLPDRNWHLVARQSRSPVSYQYMREYNEDLNASASDDTDNYGLKILLAYHEYFNNFVGF
ncbi:MAG: zinc-dependent metalloprotease [Myxococcales bacterium]|nr:zinc-dependent metalloprotease [Myxococcales bacterium]